MNFLRTAAMSWHLNLEYSEFADLLAKPASERKRILWDLASYTKDLSLCIYEAIKDLASSSEEMADWDWEYGGIKRAFDARIHRLPEWRCLLEILELRLYRLAKRVVPWKAGQESSLFPPEIKFLSRGVVPGDAWATFVLFSKAWASKGNGLEQYLPSANDLAIVEPTESP